MTMNVFRIVSTVVLVTTSSLIHAGSPHVSTRVPTSWAATVPPSGGGDSRNWWRQFDEPLVAELVAAADAASPTVAKLAERVGVARAALAGADAALLPNLSAGGSATRAGERVSGPDSPSRSNTTLRLSAEVSWDLDLFGQNRAGLDAARANFESVEAEWRSARVSVAAETASAYVNYRYCQLGLGIAQADSRSRAETARLTDLATRAGIQAPATNALASAAAALASGRAKSQAVECDRARKALAALTGLDETSLTRKLAEATLAIPIPTGLAVNQVPAEVITARPDVASARADVLARYAEVAVAEREGYPKINLLGLIAPARIALGGSRQTSTSWSVGPALTLPVFDGGRIKANIEAAKNSYKQSEIVYHATVRNAVREVESALIDLAGFADREPDVTTAVAGFAAALKAEEAKHSAGLGNIFELEEARRQTLDAQNTLLTIGRDRVLAWINLYRALGGEFAASEPHSPTR